MRVVLTVTGVPWQAKVKGAEWPADWPPPHIGEQVAYDHDLLEVRHVDYVLREKETDPELPAPYVYVVLGPPRRSL
jgi:hypothetical protein